MKVAIVTGANGFIGKALTKYLLSLGVYVYAVVTNKDELEDIKCPNLNVIEAYYEDYEKALLKIDKKIDVFFHIAWDGVYGKAFNNYELQFKNAVYAGKCFEIAEKLNCSKFILTSTINVIDAINIMNNNIVDKPIRATMNYSMAKLSAEMICKTLSSKSKTTTFNVAYLSMLYGPNNKSLMVPNVVMLNLIHGESPNLIKGEGLYDLVYIDDVVVGLVAIAEKGINNKSYYLGHSELKTFKELFQEIGNIINKDIPLNFGVYPDENYLDYSLIDLHALEVDCDFKPKADFKESILTTVEYLKNSDLYDVLKGNK